LFFLLGFEFNFEDHPKVPCPLPSYYVFECQFVESSLE
jgi:hypothetical protein